MRYDELDGPAWYNGALVEARTVRLHVLSHSLHYGSAVFEGERSYGGRVFGLRAHSQRLLESAQLMGIPVPWSCGDIEAATMEVVRANGGGDLYVRPVIWRGSEVMGVSAHGGSVHFAIAAWPWGDYFGGRTARLTMASWRRPPPDCAPFRAKASGLYTICTLARDAAVGKGFSDALMLDWRGQVAESTGANVFFVRDDVLHTPIPDCFLDGITRQTVIRLARERRLEVRERAIMPEELAGFAGCFLTGSAAEVTTVTEIDGIPYPDSRITDLLAGDYRQLTCDGGG